MTKFESALALASKAFDSLQRAGSKNVTVAAALGEATEALFSTASSPEAAMTGCEVIGSAKAARFIKSNPRPDTKDTQNDPVFLAWKALFVTQVSNPLRPMNAVILSNGHMWKVSAVSSKTGAGTAKLLAVAEKVVVSEIDRLLKAIGKINVTVTNRKKVIKAVNSRFALEVPVS